MYVSGHCESGTYTMKFGEQIQSKHYFFAILLEAKLRFWSIVWNKYSGPTIYLGEVLGSVGMFGGSLWDMATLFGCGENFDSGIFLERIFVSPPMQIPSRQQCLLRRVDFLSD